MPRTTQQPVHCKPKDGSEKWDIDFVRQSPTAIDADIPEEEIETKSSAFLEHIEIRADEAANSHLTLKI